MTTPGGGLDLPPQWPCAFCEYLGGRRPYTIWRRDELVATLVTREQRGVLHVLAAPVRHVPTILEMSDAESAALMLAVRHAARVINVAARRPGIAVWQNNGRPAGQVVAHLHIHVAATLPGGGTERGPVPELSVAETDAMARQLDDAERRLPHQPSNQ